MANLKKIFAIGMVAAMAASVSTSAVADDDASVARPTFYKDVAPLLQTNCQNCHRPMGADMGGLIAPMSLTSYAEVRPWAKSIAKSVANREMPPWHATPEFHGVFQNERTMTQGDIDTIVAWVRTGAPAGNPADAPEPVMWPTNGWSIGEPELIIAMPETYIVGDEVEDQYRNFSVDITREMLPEPRWIQGIEFKAGSEVVHHIIGYVNKEGKEGRGDRGMIGGIAPGNEPDMYPEGYGFLLRPDMKFVFAMHYHKEAGPGTATPDLSRVGFKFYPLDAAIKPLHIEPIGNNDFEIPAGHANWQVGMAKTFDEAIDVVYLMPHMHLRGKAAEYTAFYPDGSVEKLLDVPAYDFNWQTSYEYDGLKHIPAGTRIESSMWFDNSAENVSNPDPTISVRFGGPTTDEMALAWLAYAKSSDEAMTSIARTASFETAADEDVESAGGQ